MTGGGLQQGAASSIGMAMQNLVTVFGGSGFIGAQAVRQLAKAGWRIRVAVRNPGAAYAMRLHGDVGQIDIVQANVRNEASLRRALSGATAAVNLVAVAYETGRQGFQALHVMGAKNVATAARAEGVSRLVQMSALGADAASASKYARTKADGEAAAREIYPDAVVLRPSVVFGQEDDFFNRFAAMARFSPALPLPGGGHTRFQPVFVGDVADAVALAAEGGAKPGTVYELGYMAARGKLCLGYSNDPSPYADRVRRMTVVTQQDRRLVDASGLTVENFGLSDNLMMVHALDLHGCALVTPKQEATDIWHDLTAFEECLRLAANHR